MFHVDTLTGEVLGGQYTLHEIIGLGGMAAVYRAVQIGLQREVAIKILPPSLAANANYAMRFSREAEMAASLEHPHIVPVYDYGTQNNVSFVVMRLLIGGSLSDRLTQRLEVNQPLPSIHEVVSLLKQVGGALDYAHHQNIIHRDIKPSNIMFDDTGNPFLTDFGIAKIIDDEATQLTAVGHAIGTPTHMAPEQWREEKVTPASDQYAMAIVVYTMLAGVLPFQGTTAYALMHEHLNTMPRPIHTLVQGLTPEISQVIEKGMAKEATARFPNLMAFAHALQHACQHIQLQQTAFYSFTLEKKVILPQPPPSMPSVEALKSRGTGIQPVQRTTPEMFPAPIPDDSEPYPAEPAIEDDPLVPWAGRPKAPEPINYVRPMQGRLDPNSPIGRAAPPKIAYQPRRKKAEEGAGYARPLSKGADYAPPPHVQAQREGHKPAVSVQSQRQWVPTVKSLSATEAAMVMKGQMSAAPITPSIETVYDAISDPFAPAFDKPIRSHFHYPTDPRRRQQILMGLLIGGFVLFVLALIISSL